MFGGASTLPLFQQEQGGSHSHSSHIMSLRCCCWRQLSNYADVTSAIFSMHTNTHLCITLRIQTERNDRGERVVKRFCIMKRNNEEQCAGRWPRDPGMNLSQKHSSNVHICSSCVAQTWLSLRYTIIFKTKLKPVLLSNKKKRTLTYHHQRKLKSFFY